jgi:hypothetical protein
VHRPKANDWGHTLRNVYSQRATGQRVLHMDDDDVFLEGAMDVVRRKCVNNPGKLVVFQCLGPGFVVPHRHELRPGNVGTECGALPNEPDKWGRWESCYGGDGMFYTSCKFPVEWCDEPISTVRPHDWDAPTTGRKFICPSYRAQECGSIPKVFHRIWLGTQPIPDDFRRYGELWLSLNPEWKMQTWTDENLLEIRNRSEFNNCEKFAQKADVLRYELLWRFGGVYIDMDFEPLKPLGQAFDGINAFFADEKPGTPAIGILGSVPSDPFFEHLIEALPASIRAHTGVSEATGPMFFARELARYFAADWHIRRLGEIWEHVDWRRSRWLYGYESRYFYPYGYWEPQRRGERFPGSYAVHHWAHSWK